MKVITGKEAAQALANFSNTSSTQDLKDFADQLCHGEHRTLQQTAMTLFVECMKVWAQANDTGMYDARNEATVRMSARIVNEFKDQLYFPFI